MLWLRGGGGEEVGLMKKKKNKNKTQQLCGCKMCVCVLLVVGFVVGSLGFLRVVDCFDLFHYASQKRNKNKQMVAR